MGRQHLSTFDKGRIIGMAETHSAQDIARKLNRDKRTVQRLLNKYRRTGSTDRKEGSGRKRATTPREDHLIKWSAVRNRRMFATEIKTDLGLEVSTRTIRNRLHEFGLKSYWSAKKPFINAINRQKRVAWVKEHLNWTPEQWDSVLWSDESPFMLRFAGRVRVWRFHNERYSPDTTVATVKHDKKINVWGCFSTAGVGRLYLVKGNLDQHQYHSILIHHMVPSAKVLFPKGPWIFQQDNDPKHTSNKVQNYLANKKFQVMTWPAQSPDLNPIENLWSFLDQRLRDRKPNSEEELFQAIKDGWDNIPRSYLQDLVRSMPRRCQAVIDSKGFATRY